MMGSQKIELISVNGMPLINEGDDLANIITSAFYKQGVAIQEGDIIVIAHSIVSKAEGRIIHRDVVKVSDEAIRIAKENGFDSVHVELALRESRAVLRTSNVLITENRRGFISNFAGVDRSNAPHDSFVLLPEDPDKSAMRIKRQIKKISNKDIAIIITDSQGRPWRKGIVNIAIGCAGINAFKYNKGRTDTYGATLHRSTVCQIDELAAAAEPLMGQANNGRPVVIIRGYQFSYGKETAADIVMQTEENLFR